MIFFIGVLAFGDAFLSIAEKIKLSKKDEYESAFVGLVSFDLEDGSFYDIYLQGYFNSLKASFLVAIAEFGASIDTLVDFNNFDYLIFAACTLFNIIVLLNLLIAIISETYTNISSARSERTYKEKAGQLRYVMDTIYGLFKMKRDENELIFVAKVIYSHEGDDEEENIPEKIVEMKEEIGAIRSNFKAFNQQFEELRDLVME